MRCFVDPQMLLDNESFLLWYIMTSFPMGLTEEEDSLDEILGEKCDGFIDQNFIDELTGYYDGILGETDGYLNDPKAVDIDFNGNNLVIEFHAGDTIYYLNSEEIGSTGSHYKIKRIPFNKFKEFSENKSGLELLLLFPMVWVTEQESEEYKKIVSAVIEKIDAVKSISEDICYCILNNCLEES